MIKKSWYPVVLPKMFGEGDMGEVTAQDPKQLVGKRIEAGMNEITKEMSKFYIKLIFRIDKVEKGSAYTVFDGHRCMREYISHIVRSRVTRVDNNIVVSTKDGKKIRVKGILLFSKNVNRPLKSRAIKMMDSIVKERAEKSTFDEFIKLMIFGELANEIKKKAAKIYPVSKSEIRKSEVFLEK